jgi:hypothetical protein
LREQACSGRRSDDARENAAEYQACSVIVDEHREQSSVDRLLLQGIEVHPQKQVGCQGVFAAVRRSDKPAPTRSSGVDQSSSLIGNT